MKKSNPIKGFFTNWTKKKAIISAVSVLTAAGVGLGSWALWPALGLSKSEEKVEQTQAKTQEMTTYENVIVRAVSNEKDLSVSFVNSNGETPTEKFSIKLARVGNSDEVNIDELNQKSAQEMFDMNAYVEAAEKDQEVETKDEEADSKSADKKSFIEKITSLAKVEAAEKKESTEDQEIEANELVEDQVGEEQIEDSKQVSAEVYNSGIEEYQKKLDGIEGTVYTDEDGDGTIHEEGIEPGIYQVWYVPVDGYFPDQTVTNVEIKDKVEFVVDTNIEEKVVKYNAAQDVEPAQVTVTESAVTDTVAELESKAEQIVVEVVRQAAAVDPYANCPTITAEDGSTTVDKSSVAPETQLVDNAGNVLFKDEACTSNATAADYTEGAQYYYKAQETQTVYTGWQTFDGVTYYYDANHNKVTGEQTIGGVIYNFNADGSLVKALGAGIDVSKFQGNIDWNRVKAAGINYAIIRCGGRYSSSRGLFEDPKFAQNIAGANAAGLQVGLYFYSTATNTNEAVEEASLAVSLAKKGKVSLPIFIDMEDPVIPKGQATAIADAFCRTVRSAGYSTGVYASMSWWKSYLDYGTLSQYKIWIARYNSTLSGGRYTWNGRCDYWQYSESGHIDGISGTVDLDHAY
ncbi:MAG: hypothetical protein K6B67_01075 [Lachnospiraceae bacterium]|nr:hypothetical protein [Lachnospiraceae bacterium]